ncbi:hypothetical protein CS542_08095 [Pedobacter sp. IW39]|nr:hypothetical protein CS542_08095 [Pedobacter sp. IW39]
MEISSFILVGKLPSQNITTSCFQNTHYPKLVPGFYENYRYRCICRATLISLINQPGGSPCYSVPVSDPPAIMHYCNMRSGVAAPASKDPKVFILRISHSGRIAFI